MGNEKIIVEKNQGQPLLTEQIEGNSKKLYIEIHLGELNYGS